MKNKIKNIINKEEGFTLVELLAVIVILGIIVAIAIPAVGSVIDRADSDAEEAEAALIEDSARLYLVDKGPENINFTGMPTEYRVSVSDLISEGYLDERDNDSTLEGRVSIKKIETSTGTHTYTYEYLPGSVAAESNTGGTGTGTGN